VGRRLTIALTVALVPAALGLAVPASASACVCQSMPLGERFDEADAAVVGRVVAEHDGEVKGAPVRFLTIDVEQRVKGEIEKPLVVRAPLHTDCDVDVPRGRTIGLLLTGIPGGGWSASACSVVAPGPLVAEGGKPRGGVIKVGVGLVILALVLLWALVRLRKGKRPDLPGAPQP
jgi:hypothetical protein